MQIGFGVSLSSGFLDGEECEENRDRTLVNWVLQVNKRFSVRILGEMNSECRNICEGQKFLQRFTNLTQVV